MGQLSAWTPAEIADYDQWNVEADEAVGLLVRMLRIGAAERPVHEVVADVYVFAAGCWSEAERTVLLMAAVRRLAGLEEAPGDH